MVFFSYLFVFILCSNGPDFCFFLHQHRTLSAPSSPGLNKQVNSENVSPTDTLRAETSKKRRAPPPPVAASQSVPSDLGTCHIERRVSALPPPS